MAGTEHEGPLAGARTTFRWALHLQKPPPYFASHEDAEDAAKHWMEMVGLSLDVRVGLEVRHTTWSRHGFDPAWLAQTLRLADRVVSVSFATATPPSFARPWDWPLDVGFLSDPASAALKAAAAQPSYFADFVRFADVATADAQVDLLLFPGTLVEALAAIAGTPHLPEIHTVVALGGVGRARGVLDTLAALRAETGAAAAGVADVAADTARDWLSSVLGSLSHDLPLDEALFGASPRSATVLLAPHDVLATARASSALKRIAHRLTRAMPGIRAAAVASAELMDRVELDASAPVEELAERIDDTAERLDWQNETATATDTAGLAVHRNRASPRRDGRHAQAQVWLGERRLAEEPLAAGKVHRLDVRIARPDEEWVMAPGAFPSEELPPGADGHLLTVVLVAPGVLPEPQTASIWLPERDDSAPCSFHFVPPENAATFDARVTILYRSRILQTLRIRAAVGKAREKEAPLSIALESVLRANLDDLSGSAGFDVALLFNDIDGAHGLTAFAGDGADARAAFIRLGSVKSFVKSLRDELEKITRSPGDYVGLDAQATKLLLVTLARAGSTFANALRELPRMRAVLAGIDGTGRRLQVMSIDPDDLVPLELAYDRVFPDVDAELCPGLKPGGACGDGCPNDRKTVCARGFWGIRHVIERRLYEESVAAEIQSKGAEYALRSEPGENRPALAPCRTVLFGSADKAANFDKKSFDEMVKSIEATLATASVKLVTSAAWEPWATQVKEFHPELLLLLPHTQTEAGADVLEIGADQHIAAVEIAQEKRHVCQPAPTPPTPGPLVVLLGCRTALEGTPFSSFIGAFRQAHASVVIATLSTVRGRHMAPVAKEAIELLMARANGPRCSIGEVVRDLRLRVLAKGLPIGLALVAFGEADWQLGGAR